MKNQKQSLVECVNLCMTCAEECITCARRCEDAGDDELFYCANLCRDCADACQKVIDSSAKKDDELLECAEICRLCAAECNKHKRDFCKACAQIAMKCYKKCNNVVKEGQLVLAAILVTKARTSFGYAAVASGLIAGAAFFVAQLIMVPLFLGDNIWIPSRVIGAIVFGEDILQPAGSNIVFDAGIVLSALVLHFILSVFFATIIGFAIRKVEPAPALMIGALAGLVIYFINFYGFTALFPWFEMSRNWVSVVAHLIFGILAAWSFVRIYHPNVKGEK